MGIRALAILRKCYQPYWIYNCIHRKRLEPTNPWTAKRNPGTCSNPVLAREFHQGLWFHAARVAHAPPAQIFFSGKQKIQRVVRPKKINVASCVSRPTGLGAPPAVPTAQPRAHPSASKLALRPQRPAHVENLLYMAAPHSRQLSFLSLIHI